MAEIVRMPKLSDTMTEGVVASWLKQVGDEVENGEILAEIETDKATMEFESFFDGVLLHIGVEQGGMAPVDSLLCILGEKGEDISKILKAAATAAAAEEKVAAPAPAPAPVASPAPAPAQHRACRRLLPLRWSPLRTSDSKRLHLQRNSPKSED